jgi:hypothetical protein
MIKDKDATLTESYFDYSNTAYPIDFGDMFNPRYGFDSVELTDEDIKALCDGKVLITAANEYTFLIRLKSNKESNESEVKE